MTRRGAAEGFSMEGRSRLSTDELSYIAPEDFGLLTEEELRRHREDVGANWFRTIGTDHRLQAIEKELGLRENSHVLQEGVERRTKDMEAREPIGQTEAWQISSTGFELGLREWEMTGPSEEELKLMRVEQEAQDRMEERQLEAVLAMEENAGIAWYEHRERLLLRAGVDPSDHVAPVYQVSTPEGRKDCGSLREVASALELHGGKVSDSLEANVRRVTLWRGPEEPLTWRESAVLRAELQTGVVEREPASTPLDEKQRVITAVARAVVAQRILSPEVLTKAMDGVSATLEERRRTRTVPSVGVVETTATPASQEPVSHVAGESKRQGERTR